MAGLTARAGGLTKLAHSNSLYDIGNGVARIYIRYSKIHERGSAFYGLRESDLRQLDGHQSFIVFLWDTQPEPLFVPYASYEEIFRSTHPSADGQYKAQLFFGEDEIHLYLARLGRFNLEGLGGWWQLDQLLAQHPASVFPALSHCQVQSIVSAIGAAKGYDIWIPQSDRGKFDSIYGGALTFRDELPIPLSSMADFLQEIDVLWLGRGSNRLHGMFEVEHSTSIYSALLRFNDVHLTTAERGQNYRIIANGSRRQQFVRHLNRPTFRSSGLDQICTFLDYRNVYGWYQRICKPATNSGRVALA